MIKRATQCRTYVLILLITHYALPFPPHFETPKFDRYRGKGDPRDHIKEFFMACIEVAIEYTYLMRLFPKSLGGSALEWFSHLPLTITSWGDIAEHFIANFSHNIETPVTLMDLCAAKQYENETFVSFIQR